MAIRRAHARHILVRSKGEAAQLRERIEKARKHSTCPSSSKGGDLGWFQERQMAREFSAAVWEQDLNAIGPFVKTGFGYHLIWVHERDD